MNLPDRPLSLPFVALVVVIIGASVAMVLLHTDAALYSALVGVAVVAAIPFVRCDILTAILAPLVVGAIWAGLRMATGGTAGEIDVATYAPETLLNFVAFGAVAATGFLCARVIGRLKEEAAYRDTVIRELSLRDAETGATKQQHTLGLLMKEIERARRYGHPVTLAILGVDDWERVVQVRGQEEATRILGALGEIIRANLRLTDVLGRQSTAQFLLILPETSLAGAEVVCERVIWQAEQELQVKLRGSITQFPLDAPDAAVLIREAEAAYALARAVDISLATRTLLAP